MAIFTFRNSRSNRNPYINDHTLHINRMVTRVLSNKFHNRNNSGECE